MNLNYAIILLSESYQRYDTLYQIIMRRMLNIFSTLITSRDHINTYQIDELDGKIFLKKLIMVKKNICSHIDVKGHFSSYKYA